MNTFEIGETVYVIRHNRSTARGTVTKITPAGRVSISGVYYGLMHFKPYGDGHVNRDDSWHTAWLHKATEAVVKKYETEQVNARISNKLGRASAAWTSGVTLDEEDIKSLEAILDKMIGEK